MNSTIICPHCGSANPDDLSFCTACSKFLRSTYPLRSLTLVLGILTVVSALLWGAVLYVELNR